MFYPYNDEINLIHTESMVRLNKIISERTSLLYWKTYDEYIEYWI